MRFLARLAFRLARPCPQMKHRIAGLVGPAVEGMASGEALNVYERSRPTAPAKLTELGEKLLGVRPWH